MTTRNLLLQLMADNRTLSAQRATSRTILAKSEDGAEATLYIYDTIVPDKLTAEWMGGVCPQDLVPAIAELDVKVINVRINSPGGSVFAARTICTALEQHPAKVIAHIDGVAASAATVIACSADEVAMSEGALYMIHNSMTFAFGDKSDFLEVAALLEKCDGIMVKNYADRTDKPEATVKGWMDAETWFTAEEALEAGFVDRLAEGKSAKAQQEQPLWNLSAYKNAPKPLATPPAPTVEPHITDEHRERQRQRVARVAACIPRSL